MATMLDSILSAFNKDAAGAAAVTKLAKQAIRRAYARDDMLMVQVMLDNMTRNYKDRLPAFFKRAGILMTPATPAAPWIANRVDDKSKQAKVFAWLDRDDVAVVNPDDIAVRDKAAPKDEADAAKVKAIIQSRLDKMLGVYKKNGQANLAAELQRRLAAPKVERELVHEPGTLVTTDGRVFQLDVAESEAVLSFLTQRQIVKGGLSIPSDFERLIPEEARQLAA